MLEITRYALVSKHVGRGSAMGRWPNLSISARGRACQDSPEGVPSFESAFRTPASDPECPNPALDPANTMKDSAYPNASNLQRHLASLKVISRLLGHELHTQTGGKTITLSREEVTEVQTSLDLFIEEATRFVGNGGTGGRPSTSSLGDANLVPTRN